MEERENRKGPGVFYAVIGVATLVVAIIGATFAYFSVTVTSGANDVKGTTGQGALNTLTLSVTPATENDGKLIPLNEGTQMTQALTNKCIDSNQNTVCRVYKVVITNGGDNAVRLAGKMELTSDAPNMKWKLVNGTETSGNYTFTDNTTAVVNSVGAATDSDKKQFETNKVLANKDVQDGSNAATYYLVVWLHETGVAQDVAGEGTTDEDLTSYTGLVTFSAVDATGTAQGGLTATFSS